MSIYRYMEIKYLENFVTIDIILVPSNIINIRRGARTTLMKWHRDEGLGREQNRWAMKSSEEK